MSRDNSNENTKFYYQNYSDWKNWNQPFPENSRSFPMYAREFSNIKIKGKKILEIGFGQGDFLVWCKKKQADCVGLEIQESLVKEGINHGFQTFLFDDFQWSQFANQFDLVVAFDVVEHISPDQLFLFFNNINLVLKKEGLAFLRFPNAQSPFSSIYQHGDLTHVNFMSSAKIAQLIKKTDLKIIEARNPKHGLWTSNFFTTIAVLIYNLLIIPIRRCFQIIFSLLFMNRIIPLDPNIVVILKKEISV